MRLPPASPALSPLSRFPHILCPRPPSLPLSFAASSLYLPHPHSPPHRSGRWRSEYTLDTAAQTLTGKILLNVHYYEQGNVQLSTTHTVSLTLPPAITPSGGASAASKALALVEAEEGRYQTGLNEAYAEMGDKTFKSLRRALPMTRSKLDWDRVLGYKLGQELTNSKGVFGQPA